MINFDALPAFTFSSPSWSNEKYLFLVVTAVWAFQHHTFVFKSFEPNCSPCKLRPPRSDHKFNHLELTRWLERVVSSSRLLINVVYRILLPSERRASNATLRFAFRYLLACWTAKWRCHWVNARTTMGWTWDFEVRTVTLERSKLEANRNVRGTFEWRWPQPSYPFRCLPMSIFNSLIEVTLFLLPGHLQKRPEHFRF